MGIRRTSHRFQSSSISRDKRQFPYMSDEEESTSPTNEIAQERNVVGDNSSRHEKCFVHKDFCCLNVRKISEKTCFVCVGVYDV